VVVAPGAAHLAATQHTSWMLINLLARAVGVVHVVRVVGPAGVQLAGRVVPLAPHDLGLVDALCSGGQAIGAVPVHLAAVPAAGDTVLVIGTGDPVPGQDQYVSVDGHADADSKARMRYVAGNSWWGGVSDRPFPELERPVDLPFGPYVAAALAAAEVYLDVRLPDHVARAIGTYGWDCWRQTLTTQPDATAPTDLSGLDLTGTALAGVGAVGTTWVHALWATPGLTGDVTLADADEKGVTTTNLNRCPLFGRTSLNKAKAQEAARIANDCAITWHPHHGRLEALDGTPTMLISAVDTNRARYALQQRYPPRILSASTRDLRAEVLRAGPPGAGACLRCYNPPEPFVGDDALRAQARADGPGAVRNLAVEASVAEADVQRWLDRGDCDEVGTRLLTTLRRNEPEPPARFAVGFTSVMAGVLLATETIKTLLDHPMTPGSSDPNNATIQFLNPTAPVNNATRLAPDPRCPACTPTNPATTIWQRRIAQLNVSVARRRPA
jgi:hypothetical protein